MVNYSEYSHLFNAPWSIEYHEKITWDYVKLFLNSGCVFFDIGCQKGIFSEGVLNLLKENCSVYGFDVLQHPEILDLQEKFSNFKFINSAVGDGEDIECMINYDTDTFVENEKSISLDDFCIQNQIDKVDFIKIDVDGCEQSVLNGCKNILRTQSPILMIEMVNTEEDHKRLKIEMDNKEKCRNILYQYGYKDIGVTNQINYFFKK